MEEQNIGALVYNVTIETKQGKEQRKAIDVISLKSFLEDKKSDFSVLNLDLSQIESTDTVHQFIARAAQAVLVELEEGLNKTLGIAPVEPEVEPEPEREIKEAPSPAEPKLPTIPEIDVPEVPEPKVEDNRVVL